jgi:LmbE family N-acetylglucosaminyl deacetylase
MSQSVLVVAPHPDDESIGCGGTICLHHRQGDRVQALFLTSGERGVADSSPEAARAIREAEARAAGELLFLDRLDFLRLPDLGVAEHIESGAFQLSAVLEALAPDVIYLPHPGEAHPDHQSALPLVRRALASFRVEGGGAPFEPELRVYEVWSPMTIHGWAEDISPFMRRKLAAVRCYQSQLECFRYDRAVRGLNQYRGCLAARCRYAEVFQYAAVCEED